MSLDERKARWTEMMDILRVNTVEAWVQRFLTQLGGDCGMAGPVEPETFLNEGLTPGVANENDTAATGASWLTSALGRITLSH